MSFKNDKKWSCNLISFSLKNKKCHLKMIKNDQNQKCHLKMIKNDHVISHHLL